MIPPEFWEFVSIEVCVVTNKKNVSRYEAGPDWNCKFRRGIDAIDKSKTENQVVKEEEKGMSSNLRGKLATFRISGSEKPHRL